MQHLHAASIYYNLLLFFVVYARQKRQKESFTVLVVIAYHFICKLKLSVQVIQRVHCLSVNPDFKMQVRSGASARVSAQGNFLPLADLLSDADQNLAQVSIAGFSAIRMLNVNDVAIAAAPACPCNRTAAGCHDRRTDGGCPVNSLMIRGRSLLGCFSACQSQRKAVRRKSA